MLYVPMKINIYMLINSNDITVRNTEINLRYREENTNKQKQKTRNLTIVLSVLQLTRYNWVTCHVLLVLFITIAFPLLYADDTST